MRYQKGGDTTCRNLLSCLTKCQSLGLCKEICHEQIMMRLYWIQCLIEANEITGNQSGSLVNKLVEGMLTIGTGLAPDNRSGLIVDGVAFQIDVLTIALHIKLLQISAQTIEILVIRQNCHSFSTEEIIIPDTNQPKYHRQVA